MISENEKNSFELEMDNFDEETLNDYDNSSCDRDEITGSPELRMQELRLLLLCWVFSIKFFQMVFASAFTLIAIQWDEMNVFVANNWWIVTITAIMWFGLFYCLKKIRFCRRIPINLIMLLVMTFAMAYTFAGLAIYVWPFPYMILVALATASTIFFMIIPVALVLKVDENGHGMYKHIVATLIGVIIISNVPYFLSIGPRYNISYPTYMFNVVCGAVAGAALCVEAFYNYKRHMNSGRLTSLANLESIFSASIA